jgi:hypothetical protein
MTDSGLSTRLRQQSRRAGLMVGITMALAIAICIFGAALLFGALSRPFSDLIPAIAPAAELNASDTQADAPDAETPAPDPAIETNDAEPTAAPAAEPTTAPTQQAFEPTHQISANGSVNFRTGPSTSDSVIIALSPATPLQFLDEEVPADNGLWMKFRSENGDEGWILEDLTEPYQP